MFSSLHVEALLTDSDHVDRVWEKWYSGRISDSAAAQEWTRIAVGNAAQQRASAFASVQAPQQPQTGR